ncbi:predicted protein [Naegleria gruberi]|uniref:Predicted protein n=1 Tax=Naegleria gruberi TaxID=5762 RepID=D2VYC7_NAEGR|nr:uncharacterized protein NAEGRDRAFT_81705 [Naegleria gruberi]EFC38184.1 predicted protein [Naegleria gruberi]|eukprot:XP_002670928.1 predicted protein [Naegleria gruberi strain NEG-M]
MQKNQLIITLVVLLSVVACTVYGFSANPCTFCQTSFDMVATDKIGNLTFEGDFHASGIIAMINDSLIVDGSSLINGSIDHGLIQVNGSVASNGSLMISISTWFSNGSLLINGSFDTDEGNAFELNGTLGHSGGFVYSNQSWNTNGSLTIQGDLILPSMDEFSGTLQVNGTVNSSISGDLSIIGSMLLDGSFNGNETDFNMNGILTHNGLFFQDNETVTCLPSNNSLNGTAVIDGTMKSSDGQLYINGSMIISGTFLSNENLELSGYLANNVMVLEMTGTISLPCSTLIDGNLTVNGNLNSTVGSMLTINGTTHVNGNLTLSHALLITGNLTIHGTVHLNNTNVAIIVQGGDFTSVGGIVANNTADGALRADNVLTFMNITDMTFTSIKVKSTMK